MRIKRSGALMIAALAVTAAILPVQTAVGVSGFSASATVTTQASMATLPNLDDVGTGQRDRWGTVAAATWRAPELRSDVSASYVITRTIDGQIEAIDPLVSETGSVRGFTDDLTVDGVVEEVGGDTTTTCPVGWFAISEGVCGAGLDRVISYQINYTALGWSPMIGLEIPADPVGGCGGHHDPGAISIYC